MAFKAPFSGFGGRLTVMLLLGLTFSACSNNKPIDADTTKASNGHIDSITVYCDEAFQYLMGEEIEIYERAQPEQHLHMIYQPESEVLKHLFEDSFAVVIVGRRLHEQERSDLLHRTNIQAEEHAFATDAVALIAAPGMDRDTIPFTSVLSLLTNSSHDYDLVFEGNGSGVITYMFAQIARTSVRPSAYAAKSLGELVDYVRKDKKAIGFIPFSRISDEHDTAAAHLLKKVKVLYICHPDSIGRLISATACQSEIADGSYPLDRPINFISHSMEEKVGTGFVNFLYKEQSGRIILKSGLVPAIMPQRVINVNTDGIK